MYMIHLLMSDPAGVQDDPKAVRRALLAGELSGKRQHLAERPVLCHAGFVQRRDVLFGDDQQVHRREGISGIDEKAARKRSKKEGSK